MRGKTGTAKVLLEAGADTEALNAWGRSAAFIAAWENRVEIMRLLLKHGMNASGCAAHDHWGPIHKAAEMGHVAIAGALLAAGVDPTVQNRKAQDALRLAKDAKMRALLEAAVAAWAPAPEIALPEVDEPKPRKEEL